MLNVSNYEVLNIVCQYLFKKLIFWINSKFLIILFMVIPEKQTTKKFRIVFDDFYNCKF